MGVIIPFLTYGVWWYGLNKRLRNGCVAFFLAAAAWGAAVFALCEILSIFHALSFYPLLFGWCFLLIATVFLQRPHWCCPNLRDFSRFLASLSLVEKLMLILIIAMIGVKAYSALMSAPNTADAMTYHLSRIEHWIQDQSVTDYPTHILRQLYYPVFSEYIILNLMILSGGDRLANFVQCFACIGSLIAVLGLARLLGADRRGQCLAVFLAATLPMGLLQATSTQTDYVMTFWLAGFVFLLWTLYLSPRLSIALGTGVCLGLALLTKGNAYIFAPAWLLIYAAMSLRSPLRGRLGQFLALIILIGILINLPYAVRNINAFGSANLPAVSLTNAKISPSIVIDNSLLNLGLHLGTPWDGVNQFLNQAFERLASYKGADFNIRNPSTGEDDAGNGLYVLFFLLTLVTMSVDVRLPRRQYGVYAAALGLMMVFFCAIVRFQPWGSRFHLAIFVLSCPLAGAVLAHLFRRWLIVVVILLFAFAWPWLMMCHEHPLLGSKNIFSTTRMQQYFSERPNLIVPYTLTVKGVVTYPQECRDIGLIQGEDDWEYPWWVLLHQAFGRQFRLENVDVHNASSRLPYPKGDFIPCMLITRGETRSVITLPQGLFVRVWFIDLPQGMTSIFVKQNP